MDKTDLAGLRILLVEDEYMLASALKEYLEWAGAEVVGPAPSVRKATACIEQAEALDGAILDINLGGEKSYAVAQLLMDRGIRFLFTTGYDQGSIPRPYASIPCCKKPFAADELVAVLKDLLS